MTNANSSSVDQRSGTRQRGCPFCIIFVVSRNESRITRLTPDISRYINCVSCVYATARRDLQKKERRDEESDRGRTRCYPLFAGAIHYFGIIFPSNAMYIESLSARYRCSIFHVLLSRSILDNPSFDSYAKHPGIFFLLLASESPFVWKKARARISRGGTVVCTVCQAAELCVECAQLLFS